MSYSAGIATVLILSTQYLEIKSFAIILEITKILIW